MEPIEEHRGDQPEDEVEVICREILEYLARNPGSRDTLEGIADWWLLEHDIRRARALVRRGVARLVERGLLRERRGPDGRRHYSLVSPPGQDGKRRGIGHG